MRSVPAVAGNYYEGRVRPIRAAVLHAAQCPCETGRAYSTMVFLSNRPPGARASAHYCTDPDETVAGVAEEDTAFTTPDLNADGINIEQAGFAEFGSGFIDPVRYPQWSDYYGGVWPNWTDPLPTRMIERQTVPLVADICRRRNIPPVVLEPADLLNPDARGITDHWRATLAFNGGSGHWDCGDWFPIYDVVAKVDSLLHHQDPITEILRDDRMYLFREEGSDNIYLVRNGKKATLNAAFNSAGTGSGLHEDDTLDHWSMVWKPTLEKLHDSKLLVTDPDSIPSIDWRAMWLIPNGPADGS